MQTQKKHHRYAESRKPFHDELILKLLSCAKVKSLIRFKSVCKLWNSFISNSSFIKSHLQKSLANDSLAHLRIVPKFHFKNFHEIYKVSCSIHYLLDHSSPSNTIDLANHTVLDNYLVVGSCNGLHCIVSNIEPEGYKICFWNMALRLRSKYSPYLHIVDKRFPRTKFGFGYDSLSDTYKVVALVLYGNVRMFRANETKVYSMGDNYWRNVEDFPAIQSVWDDGVYLSGTLNWGVKGVANAYLPLVIVSFDLGQETWTQLMLPDDFDGLMPSLGVLGDSLCVWHDYNNTHRLIIWQMKEFRNEKSWIQLLNVSYLSLQTHPLPIHPMLIPFCMLNNGDVLIFSSNVAGDKQAILYSPRDDTLKHFQIPNPSDISLIDVQPMMFIESLIMPY